MATRKELEATGMTAAALGWLGFGTSSCYNRSVITNLPEDAVLPRKIRELIADLESAGFENRGGKNSHRNFAHPKVAKPVTLSSKAGDDAKKYQERAVNKAIEESKS